MKIVSPIFKDKLIYSKIQIDKANIIDRITSEFGGAYRLKKFKIFEWILPSGDIFEENFLKQNVQDAIIIIDKKNKTTFAKPKKFKIPIISGNDVYHFMYGEYFDINNRNLKSIYNNSIISVDFAGIALKDIDKNLNFWSENSHIIFCSGHDFWSNEKFLIELSIKNIVIFHEQNYVKVIKNKNITLFKNVKNIKNKYTRVGAGDFFALSILEKLNLERNLLEQILSNIAHAQKETLKFI